MLRSPTERTPSPHSAPAVPGSAAAPVTSLFIISLQLLKMITISRPTSMPPFIPFTIVHGATGLPDDRARPLPVGMTTCRSIRKSARCPAGPSQGWELPLQDHPRQPQPVRSLRGRPSHSRCTANHLGWKCPDCRLVRVSGVGDVWIGRPGPRTRAGFTVIPQALPGPSQQHNSQPKELQAADRKSLPGGRPDAACSAKHTSVRQNAM